MSGPAKMLMSGCKGTTQEIPKRHGTAAHGSCFTAKRSQNVAKLCAESAIIKLGVVARHLTSSKLGCSPATLPTLSADATSVVKRALLQVSDAQDRRS